MTVAARSANFPAEAATVDVEQIDMRSDTPVRAGTYLYDSSLDDTGDLVTNWHRHDLHQIEYTLEGVAEVETHEAHLLLPPQQALWIPAGLPHRTTLKGVRSVAVFFDPGMVPVTDQRARVLAASPVIREMMTYAVRWPISRATSDATADAFFGALALLAADWLEHEAPLLLPSSTDPVTRAVMDSTQAHLRDATTRSVGAELGISERTLRRHFVAATGMTWREYLLTSRLLRAMALLSEPHRTVLDVATEVGFDSVSAFARVFRRLTGETPTAFRRRVTSPPQDSSNVQAGSTGGDTSAPAAPR